MTIVNGIEIDNIQYRHNEIKSAIANNEPIEEKLNVIIVMSNPCRYARRYILTKEFILRMEREEADRVNLFVVELAYGNQPFLVAKEASVNSRHLQLRGGDTPLWHKENMINIAVQQLLVPRNYKAFAWIDADVEFENFSWAEDTLKILNGCKDMVQLFSHCVDMDLEENTLNVFNGFGYSFSKEKSYTKAGRDYWHPGFAWAMTRRAFEKIGGLYDKGILGSGDSIMALSLINRVDAMTNRNYSRDYNQSMIDCQTRMSSLRLGYTPGVIRHHYHGSKQNRMYTERWKILMKHDYSPDDDLLYDAAAGGLLVPSANVALYKPMFAQDIMNYFRERKEDDNK